MSGANKVSEISLIVTSDIDAGAINKSPDGSAFSIKLEGNGIVIPIDAYNVSVAVEESGIWWTVPNFITDVNDLIYITGPNDSNVLTNFIVRIPQGLYDLTALNTAIQSELEALGARTIDPVSSNPLPLIALLSDNATQKVRLRINYDNVSVDFTQPNTFREILGFESQIYGPYSNAPLSILAENTASFNQVNYFLIHSDMVRNGLRFNNNYNQTIAQVLINVPPGSQIISTPFNPAKSEANDLAGNQLSRIRFWLTDDKNRPVNTNGENWGCRITLRYQT